MEPGSKSAVGGAVAIEGRWMKDDGEGGSLSEAVRLDMRMEIIEDGAVGELEGSGVWALELVLYLLHVISLVGLGFLGWALDRFWNRSDSRGSDEAGPVSQW